MERRLSAYTGCLLGLAVGDGLGHGPERLNGYLPVSSHTQQAAYACNGLLLGVTQGQLSGIMAPPVRYIAMALQEWAAGQLWRRDTLPARCWISRSPRLDFRRCEEPGILDVLTENGGLMTITDIQKNVAECADLSNQKVSALVRQLKDAGLVIKTEDKRKSYFSKA